MLRIQSKALLFVVCCLLFSGYSLANSGKAIISHIEAFSAAPGDNQTDTLFYITNIASESVTVKVTIYNETGDVVSDGDNSLSNGIIKAENVTNYTEGTTYTANYDVAANATSRLWLDVDYGDWIRGYAIIEWEKSKESSSILPNALVANVLMYRSFNKNVGYYIIQANHGDAF